MLHLPHLPENGSSVHEWYVNRYSFCNPFFITNIYQVLRSLPNFSKRLPTLPPPRPPEKRHQQSHMVHRLLFLSWVLSTDQPLIRDMLLVRFSRDIHRLASPLPARKTAPAAANGTLPLNPLVSFLYCPVSTRYRALHAIRRGSPPCRLASTRMKNGSRSRGWYTPPYSFGAFLVPTYIY